MRYIVLREKKSRVMIGVYASLKRSCVMRAMYPRSPGYLKTNYHARVAKLAYAMDLKSIGRNTLRVRFPSFAPLSRCSHQVAESNEVRSCREISRKPVYEKHF